VVVTIHGTLISHLLPGDAVSLASASTNSAEPGPLYIRPGYILNVVPARSPDDPGISTVAGGEIEIREAGA
jgi:hypothetical protein